MKYIYIQYAVILLMLIILPVGITCWIMVDSQKLYDKCAEACAPASVLRCEKEYALCNYQVGMVPIK